MNLFELFFKIGVKDEASGEVKKLSDKLGKGLKASAKIGLSAVGAAAAGVAALTKQSLESYAEYEQLVGGVETLFGAGGKTLEEYANSVGKSTSEAAEEYGALMKAQQTVLDNADAAYVTAGLSANEYMSTVTSFSASLLQSLDGDTQAAADLANQALIDMSDNANKMGNDMAMIQNAYQGFAKANYTMLDNLRLGYSGSQSEMRRLIKDAAALDKSVDASSMSFANIVKAIKAVQDNMGITGTTSAEATTTIQGSANMAKAAWENLKVALADENGDVEAAADRFAESLGTLGDNVLPRVKKILKSIPRLIKEVGPDIIRELPSIVDELAPDAADAVADLAVAAIEVIPSLGVEVVEAIDKILEEVGDSLAEKFPAFGWLFDDLEDKVWAIIAAITAFKTIKGVTDFINSISTAMTALTARTTAQTTAQTNLNAATLAFKGAVVTAGLTWLIPQYFDIAEKAITETKENIEEMKENGGKMEFVGWEAYDTGMSWWDQLLYGLGFKSLDEITDGSHRLGLSRVPYDGYIAELHEGERVLTKSEARDYRGSRGGVTVNVNIDGAKYSDEESLADAVVRKLQKLFDDEDAVYA